MRGVSFQYRLLSIVLLTGFLAYAQSSFLLSGTKEKVAKSEKSKESKEDKDADSDEVIEEGAYEALIPFSTSSISPFLYFIVYLVLLDDDPIVKEYSAPDCVQNFRHTLLTFNININAP